MPNVIKFQTGSAGSRMDAPRFQAGNVFADVNDSQLLNRLVELQARASRELQRVVALLDLAVSNVRKVADRVADPDVRGDIENQIGSIERTVQVARKKARDLQGDEPPVC